MCVKIFPYFLQSYKTRRARQLPGFKPIFNSLTLLIVITTHSEKKHRHHHHSLGWQCQAGLASSFQIQSPWNAAAYLKPWGASFEDSVGWGWQGKGRFCLKIRWLAGNGNECSNKGEVRFVSELLTCAHRYPCFPPAGVGQVAKGSNACFTHCNASNCHLQLRER